MRLEHKPNRRPHLCSFWEVKLPVAKGRWRYQATYFAKRVRPKRPRKNPGWLEPTDKLQRKKLLSVILAADEIVFQTVCAVSPRICMEYIGVEIEALKTLRRGVRRLRREVSKC